MSEEKKDDKDQTTERNYGEPYESTFRNIGELIYLYGNIDPLINILLCESLGIPPDDNVIRSVLNHVPSNKRIEMIEERIKASQVDGSETDEIKEISEIISEIKIVKSMRDVISHCSWKIKDNMVYFIQTNSTDYEKVMRRMNKNIQRLANSVTKSKSYDQPDALARAIAEAFEAEAPKKNSTDLNEALLSARKVMEYFVKRHKEKGQETPIVRPS